MHNAASIEVNEPKSIEINLYLYKFMSVKKYLWKSFHRIEDLLRIDSLNVSRSEVNIEDVIATEEKIK
jgi:hypothetical protein